MNKSIRLVPSVTAIIKNQIKITDDGYFILHASKPDTYLSDFENVQMAYKKLTSFAAKWESTVSLNSGNNNDHSHYGEYTLKISIDGPLSDRIKKNIVREQKIQQDLEEQRLLQELEKKSVFLA